jgi:hypothetical protein
MAEAATDFYGFTKFNGVILSLRRIWREADMRGSSSIVTPRARSFRTKVRQDDAVVVGKREQEETSRAATDFTRMKILKKEPDLNP